ncbi:MAG: 2'-5' RNA ligase family protein [Methanoregula sp.]|nr:2'-5' RNA ligase family protein [Methanoregula sp.]
MREIAQFYERIPNLITQKNDVISMNNYLIEIWFRGKAKGEIKRLIYQIDNKFSLGITQDKRPIPHITLCGSISTDNEAKLVKDFIRICSETPMTYFQIIGYGVFDSTNVVFINVNPSDKLADFRWKLSKTIQPYCQLGSFDYGKNFNFHATLAMHLPDYKFAQIKDYIRRLEEPRFKHFVIRMTLLKNGKILYEYDFLLRKTLNRYEALDKKIFGRTMELLQKYFEGTYDPDKRIQQISVNNQQHGKTEKFSFVERIKQTIKNIFSRF